MAHKLNRELHDLAGLALGLNNLGLALEQSGDTERARRTFEESFESASEAHDEAAVARALSSMGTMAFERGDYSEAEELYTRAVSRAQSSGERGLRAEMELNLAAAVRETRGPAEAEALVERIVDAAQESYHYDTAYRASAEMARWSAEDGRMDKAGVWSAHALLFGPLLGDQVEAWAAWIVSLFSSISDENRDCERFLAAMESTCRRLEDEHDLDGQLIRGVDTLRSALS